MASCLFALTVADIIQDTPTYPLLAVSASTAVEDVLDLLLEHDILSVPVRHPRHPDRFLAFIGVYEVSHVLFQSLSGCQECLKQPVEQFLHVSPDSDAVKIVFSPKDSVFRVIQTFLHQHIHRALVMSSVGKEEDIHVVTQMDLARCLLHHCDKLPDSVMDRTLQQVYEQGGLHLQPATVSVHDTALACFAALISSQHGAVLVVDDAGYSVAQVDPSLVRGLDRRRWDELHQPILRFLSQRNAGEIQRPYVVRGDFTLRQVLAGLIRQGLHSAWLALPYMSQANTPVGSPWLTTTATKEKETRSEVGLALVTLTDILRCFV